MKTLKWILVSAIFLFAASACRESVDDCAYQGNFLKINQYQVLASHNSYRLRTYDPILQFMYANPQLLPPDFNPDDWDYSHVALEEQFSNYGIRSIEIDVYDDPDGGLFYNRMGLFVLGMPFESGEPALLEPGLKVLHVPDLDYQTHYLTFKQTLQAVKNWSERHYDHLPIVIQIEPKEDNIYELMGPPFTNTKAFTKTSLGTIDQEIRAVFGADLPGVITPDDIRGNYSSLNEAVQHNAWPELILARGKVIFVMDGSGNETADYLDGHPSLANRAMFVYAEPGKPEAAFLKYEDPRDFVGEIQNYVAKGYMIRTRADADTREARTGDVTRREAAFASGAQIISTDYYRPDPRGFMGPGWTTYCVKMPAGIIALPNPVNAPATAFDCPIGEY
ncbi:MAG: Ca2+-dependent phosphoinositide-specific phospholipase C [Saprospiraceae bacterium]|nr:hypothetical protein [Lewinellaceae bacterium]